ncbi:MAG: hypothetical protein FWD58_07775, partial [Firmicutes bacterium]|nr:hypothetical protein [Bacillota bacterium]
MKLKNKLLSALIVVIMAAALSMSVTACDGLAGGGSYTAATNDKVAALVDDTIDEVILAAGFASLDELLAEAELPASVKNDITQAVKSLKTGIVSAMKKAGITDAEAN